MNVDLWDYICIFINCIYNVIVYTIKYTLSMLFKIQYTAFEGVVVIWLYQGDGWHHWQSYVYLTVAFILSRIGTNLFYRKHISWGQ